MAAERGLSAYVFAAHELAAGGGAAAVAQRLDAVCAVGKRRAPAGEISLSPASVRSASLASSRVLFSSLNGARVVAAGGAAGELAVASLRNRSAAAQLAGGWLQQSRVPRVTVVPCGEQWSSVAELAGMRPCLEDYLGAGAVVDAMSGAGFAASVEASAAAATFRALATVDLNGLVGGRELVAAGFADDVALASEIDATSVVPLRVAEQTGRCFRPTRSPLAA